MLCEQLIRSEKLLDGILLIILHTDAILPLQNPFVEPGGHLVMHSNLLFWRSESQWCLWSFLSYFSITRNWSSCWHTAQVLCLTISPNLRSRIKLVNLGLRHLLPEVFDVPILRFSVTLVHGPSRCYLLSLNCGAQRPDADFAVLAFANFLRIILLEDIRIPAFAI